MGLSVFFCFWHLEQPSQAVDAVLCRPPNEAVGTSIYDEPRNTITESLSYENSASYSKLDSSLRQPPPAEMVYDELARNDYSRTVDTSDEVGEPESDSGISLNLNPSTSTDTRPYDGLQSSTLEQPQAPVVYDRLTRHDYVNTRLALRRKTCDESRLDSQRSRHPSSDTETFV